MVYLTAFEINFELQELRLKLVTEIEDSGYTLRIPLTFVDSTTAQCNDRFNLSFFCGFNKLYWVSQIQ